MSNLSDLPEVLASGSQLLHGRIHAVCESGEVEATIAGLNSAVRCRVLQTGRASPVLAEGDEVLLWLGAAGAGGGVVLGRIGLLGEALHPVVPAPEFAARPQSMVIETQGELVLRNGQARIRLGADGAIDIVCTSFVTRSQRLMRLLAPFIKLN